MGSVARAIFSQGFGHRRPGPGFVRDPIIAATTDSEEAQAAHSKRLREIGRYAEVRFTDKNDLVAQIFASAVIKALVKAEAMPSRQPRNLPFASLGSLFMGRDADLDKLRAALAAGKGPAVVGRALHGLGGVGKTRLAIEYAWRQEADYSALLFVRADDPATLNANLAALVAAEVLDLKEKDAQKDTDKLEATLRWLESHPTWLMILDNVDDEKAVAEVKKLMARLKGGRVIVTARAANFPGEVPTLELDVLAEDAATEFLLTRTRDRRALASDDAPKAREIAHELGGLALGLEQAGAYVVTERIGFGRYLKLWRESREKVIGGFDRALTSYDHDAGLAATWATSVYRLSPESRRLLDRLAMLAPDPIPDSLLDVVVPGEAAGYDARKAGAGLYAYSLITRATGQGGSAKGFVIHRLVQDFARRAMPEERRGEALRMALGWVNEAVPSDSDDVRTWPVLDPLAPHALAVARRADEAGIAEPTARLFNQLVMLLSKRARYAEAEPLSRRALTISEASLGPDHPYVAIRLNNLACLLDDTNRPDEAERLYRRALEIDNASLGSDHPNVARDLNNLALLLKQTNRPDEAEAPYRRALAILEKSLGADHPQVATGLMNLASLLYALNRLGEAEGFLRRALTISENSRGPDHPSTVAYRENLAVLEVTRALRAVAEGPRKGFFGRLLGKR
jgi:tetratricopeptide (TPR) repeat protein